MQTYVAVVVGAGGNGLVAAAELALVSWSAGVIGRNQRVGGFIDSDERTRPRDVHVDADPVGAGQAVVTGVTRQALYGTFPEGTSVPQPIRTDAARFRYGRAAVQIQVALDRPLAWSTEEF